MRNLIYAIPFMTLCLSLPTGAVAASHNIVLTDHPSVQHVTYNRHGHVRPHFNGHRYYPRRYYSPRRYYRHHRPYRQHRRYYSWHGFRTPGWHYPRSFRYHRYAH